MGEGRVRSGRWERERAGGGSGKGKIGEVGVGRVRSGRWWREGGWEVGVGRVRSGGMGGGKWEWDG